MSGGSIAVVGLDGDDTLWHSEQLFVEVQQQFVELLAPHTELDAAALDARLLEVERQNVGTFGYGVKGFTLSLLETAIDVTGERVPAGALRQVTGGARTDMGQIGSLQFLPSSFNEPRWWFVDPEGERGTAWLPFLDPSLGPEPQRGGTFEPEPATTSARSGAAARNLTPAAGGCQPASTASFPGSGSPPSTTPDRH